MAERRMFAKTIIDSDAFLDLPSTAQLLYFQLGMRADDDGFINNPKMIMRVVRASDDDINILIGKKFIIPFENGVVVIKHWKINNYIQSDRYNPTKYKELLSQLSLDENKAYTKNDECIHNGYITDTQVRLGKDSLDKVSIEKEVKHLHGEHKNVKLTDKEYETLKDELQNLCDEYIDKLSNYLAMKNVSYKSHYLTIRNWYRKDVKNVVKEDDIIIPKGMTNL